MKQYGAKCATSFSKKQVNVLYSKAKAGELKVEKWMMSKLYDLADFYGYDDNRSVADAEIYVLNILDLMFSGNLEACQSELDSFTNSQFGLYAKKYQKTFDRTNI